MFPEYLPLDIFNVRVPFLSPKALQAFEPGCVAVWKAGECQTRCQSEWLPQCLRKTTAYWPLVVAHNRGIGNFHTIAYILGNCVSGRLTKKALMAAAAGSYVVSNLTESGGSIFAETVASSIPDRQAQWAQIVFVGANGRGCYIYKSKHEHDRVRAEYNAKFKNQGAR